MIRRLRSFLPPGHPRPAPDPLLSQALESRLKAISEQCSECGACTRHCAFLKQYGSPKALSCEIAPNECEQLQLAFDCSLCGLCTAVCPQKLDPCGLFLDMRRQRIALGPFNTRPYRPLLTYEALGMSSLFSWLDLPVGCSTVFFPGCALPGSRPGVTLRMVQHLRDLIPSLGIMLTCCGKPSHDLGYTKAFSANFNSIKRRLQAHSITTVITTCPNCTKIFRQYAPELAVQTIFTLMADHQRPPVPRPTGHEREVVIHDPCPLRDDLRSQEATRILLHDLGFTAIPMRHERKHTLCCGEGGAVGFVRPELAGAWTQKRLSEADGREIVTTCAGCSAMFSRFTGAPHLADLLFPATGKSTPPPPPSRPPITYVNRLWLKFRLRALMHT
nr:(Fe-S)-binding protein [uncultured Desulfobulbus sp.]